MARKSVDLSFAIALNIVISVTVIVFLISEIWYLHSSRPWHESFHVLTAATLSLLAALGIGATLFDLKYLAHMLVLLAVGNLVIYRTILTDPDHPDAPALRSEFSDAADIHPLTRIPRAAALQLNRFESDTNMATDYDILGAFLGIDLCAGLQSKIITRSVDSLLEAWSAVGVDGPRENTIEDPKNSHLRTALFCDQPKLKLVYHPKLAATEADALADVKSGDQSVVLVGTDQTGRATSQANQPSEAAGIQVLAFHANELRLKATNSTSDTAWLIYADSYHPAWQAYVDDNPSKIYTANVAFKALPIAPGTHDVVFAFRRGIFVNPWLYVGLGLIGLAAYVCLCAASQTGRNSPTDSRKFPQI